MGFISAYLKNTNIQIMGITINICGGIFALLCGSAAAVTSIIAIVMKWLPANESGAFLRHADIAIISWVAKILPAIGLVLVLTGLFFGLIQVLSCNCCNNVICQKIQKSWLGILYLLATVIFAFSGFCNEFSLVSCLYVLVLLVLR